MTEAKIAASLEGFVVPISSLTLDPDNAREHSEENIADIAGSLKTYGQQKPVVVNASGRVVAGNGTVLAARSLGWPCVAAVQFDGAAEDEEGYAVADNRSSERAKWNEPRLGAVIERLRARGGSVRAALGFTEREAENLMVRLRRGSVKEDEPGDAEASDLPAVSPGDLWRLGEHRLLVGDSTRKEETDRLLGGELADLVFTDPPYGVNVTGAGGKAIHGDISFTLIPLLFASLEHVAKPHAWAYICGGQSNMPLYSRLFEHYFRALPRLIIWHKLGPPILRRTGYHSSFELIYYGFRAGAADYWHGGRGADECSDVWSYAVERGEARFHPTQKPVALPARAIVNSCEPGGIVFEPFAGSGSTLIAAEQTGRRCFAVEIDPGFASRIIARWQKFTGKAAERVQ